MSLTPVQGQQSTRYTDMTSSPAVDKNVQGQPADGEAPVQEDMVELTVPMKVPRKSLIKGADGRAPIENFDLQFIPKGSMVIMENEFNNVISNVVEETREKLVPPGKKVDIDDSPAGINVNRGIAALEKTAHSASLFAGFSLMGSSPAAWAGPVAAVTGPIGVMAGLNNLRKGYNLKAYFEAKKARGEEFDTVSLKKKDVTTELRKIPLDDLIRDSKDAVVMGAMSTLGSALMAIGVGLFVLQFRDLPVLDKSGLDEPL